MLFNSLEFFIFFLLVVTLYFIIPHKYRWIFLLLASCAFYMAFIPAYILILFFLIIIDYFSAIFIEKYSGNRKRIFLIISIFFTCLTLFIFKYFNFFISNIESIAIFINWNYTSRTLKLLLPVGLSFHTFQSLSYVIEVYRGKYKAERHFGIYALYVMFFPQLVAGPIERPQHLISQFYQKHYFEYERVSEGLKIIALGLFKKAVIADRLALFVNPVFDNITAYNGISLIMPVIFFGFQIYYDFSGYSDIAVGAAKIMGFNLVENFRHPYLAVSTADFWKRWHISLSTWFRDYLYIPLGGSRVNPLRWCFNIFITFLISGLWHGANWTFIIWGALHGFYYIFGGVTSNLRRNISYLSGITKFPKIQKILKIISTFLLVSFAWIFFRANNMSDAFYIVKNMFCLKSLNLTETIFFSQPAYELLALIWAFIFIYLTYIFQFKNSKSPFLKEKLLLRWFLYYSLILSIMFLGVISEMKFIYFQF